MSEQLEELIEKCKKYEHVIWLSNHLEMYETNDAGREILNNLKKYGTNVYTYPHESRAAYKSFQEYFCNNPYAYMCSAPQVYESYDIFSNSVNGYMVKLNDNIWVPMGFFKEHMGKNEGNAYDFFMKAWWKGSLDNYQKGFFNKINGIINNGISSYEKRIQLYNDAKGISDATIYANLVFYMLFLGIVGYWCINLPAAMTMFYVIVTLIIGILGIYWFRVVKNGFVTIARIRKTKKICNKIKQFSEIFLKINKQEFTTDTFLEDEERLITPKFKKEEFESTFGYIDSLETQIKKSIKPKPRDIRFATTLVMIILIVIKVLG